VVYPFLTNEEITTESQRYDCFTRNGGNSIPKHASTEAKGSNPTTGLILLWARNPFRGNFNHWQVSRNEAGHMHYTHHISVDTCPCVSYILQHVLFRIETLPSRGIFCSHKRGNDDRVRAV